MQNESKLRAILFFGIAISMFFSGAEAFARPAFLARFSADPFSRTEFRGQCSTCHVNPSGGGVRNPFGTAFEKNGKIITPDFRAEWPDHFVASVEAKPVATANGEMKATFLSSDDAIIEINGEKFQVNLKQAKIEKVDAAQVQKLTGQSSGAVASASEAKVPLKNQPVFDHHLINLPTALPYDKKSLSMRFTHRFSSAVLGCNASCIGIGELWGMDSFSYSSFGGAYNIVPRLTATVYRSPLDKTIEMGGVVQLMSEKGKEPFSAALRISVEGRNNFQEAYTTNIAVPVSRSISNFAEILAVPMFNFNANPDAPKAGPGISIGETRKNQAAIGLGTSIRFRPRTAFVMEWNPRVAGFHLTDSHNVYSFGLQRTTNGHVFEMTLSNSVGTTTSRAISTGGEGFSLGFNIYRRLH